MRKHPYLLCLAAAFVCLLAAMPALAVPSFIGPTGLIRVPTADALAPTDWNAGLFFFNMDEGNDFNTVVANLGVTEGLEAGLTVLNPDEGDNKLWLNGKYRFATENAEQPALAVGIIDLADETDTTVYVSASKSIGKAVTTGVGEITSPQFTLGVGGGQFDGLFAGVSAVLADRLTLMLEYDSDDINFGARLALTPNVRAHLAALGGFDDFGLGVSYSKGF